jgi:hypothetical protein
MAPRQSFPARRGGPPDRQRRRPQVPLDPQPDDAEHGDHDQGPGKDTRRPPACCARVVRRLDDRSTLPSHARGLFGEGVPSFTLPAPSGRDESTR